jgi:hypothetical protein
MLHSLFSKAHLKFLSMPLLGPIADTFDDWLAANGYTRDSREYFVGKLPHVDADLRSRQVKEVTDLTPPVLHDCWRTLSRTCPGRAKVVRTLGVGGGEKRVHCGGGEGAIRRVTRWAFRRKSGGMRNSPAFLRRAFGPAEDRGRDTICL